MSNVNGAVGTQIVGKTAFVVGIGDSSINRLTYLNCQYGLADAVAGQPAPASKLEVTIGLYLTDAQAAARVTATVNDYLSRAAKDTPTTVGQYSGHILTGSGQPTLVVSAGPRTVAVTIDPTLVPQSTNQALVEVAKLALDGTASFVVGAPVSALPTTAASPSAS